jgi:hypothetical protein
LPSGSHTVIFIYAPVTLQAGILASLMALLLLAFLFRGLPGRVRSYVLVTGNWQK